MVEQPEPETVVAAIEAVSAGAYIATDADGTLWAADVGDDLVRCGAGSDVWGEVDLEAYLALIEGDYRAGCLASVEMLRGLEEAKVQAAFGAFLAPCLGPRRWLIDALRAAAGRGVHVFVVSASGRVGLEVALGLAGVSWPMIAVELAPSGFVEPTPIDAGKVAAWVARGLPPPALALGDSRWDVPLLRSAEMGMRISRCDRP